MRYSQEEKDVKKKFIYSKKFLALLFFLLVFLIYSTIKIYFKKNEAVAKNKEIKMELKNAIERKKNLEDLLGHISTPQGTEEEIRNKFNVVKPGEYLIVLVEKNNQNANINNETGDNDFFEQIWNWLKKKF